MANKVRQPQRPLEEAANISDETQARLREEKRKPSVRKKRERAEAKAKPKPRVDNGRYAVTDMTWQQRDALGRSVERSIKILRDAQPFAGDKKALEEIQRNLIGQGYRPGGWR